MQYFLTIKSNTMSDTFSLEELQSLIATADFWGRSNGYPVARDYPQYEKIQAIGEILHEKGGLREMQMVGQYIRQQNIDHGILLSMLWNGVGDWMM